MKKNKTYHTASYRDLIDLAARYAFGAGSSIIRVKDLFIAAVTSHADHLRRLTGKNDLVFPKIPACAGAEKTRRRFITYSANTDRYLSLYGGVISEVIDASGDGRRVDAFHVCAALLLNPCAEVSGFLDYNGLDADDPRWAMRIRKESSAFAEEAHSLERRRKFDDELVKWRDIRRKIEAVCFGQDSAIRDVTAQIAAFRGQSPIDRKRRPLVFCFAGGTGTGKSFLAGLLRDAVAELDGDSPPGSIDLSRFSAEQLALDLIGRDPSWRDGGKQGLLSGLAKAHPGGVIILDNFDVAHPNALSIISNAITEGEIADANTHETVSLERNIMILTMNRGTEFLESGKFMKLLRANGGSVPREKLVEGLVDHLSRSGFEFGGPIGNIVKKCDLPVLFSRLDYESTEKVVRTSLRKALETVEKTFGAETEIDTDRFTRFIMDTFQNFDSAHGIDRAVEDVIVTRLQNVCMDIGYDSGKCAKIRYEIDDIPPLEPGSHDPTDMKKRTAARLASAKRLGYGISAKFDDGTCTIHIGDFKYATMPSIEDSDWFSVRPPDVTWNDLVGLDTPRLHVRRILEHFRNGKTREIEPETGILLWGPPGTGKTSFAKAVASEINAPFISVCGADFQATHNDNRAIQRIHRLFSAARRNKAVIFIDEIDAIGNRDSVIGAQASVINAFLAELDGTDERKVLVIGATNRVDRLDPALTRSGRLHHLVKIDNFRKPDDRRKLIETLSFKAGKTLPAELADFIVETTHNWSPAAIRSVLRETFHAAGDSTPSRKHFVAARMTEFEGTETQHMELSGEELHNVALHEAGHVLLTNHHGKKWIQVSLRGGINSLGFIEHICNNACISAKNLTDYIDIALAGHAAELVAGDASEGSEGDFRKATDFACRLIRSGLCGDGNIACPPHGTGKDTEWDAIRPKVNAILNERLTATIGYLRKNTELLKATAEKLIRKGILFPDELPSPARRRRSGTHKERSRA